MNGHIFRYEFGTDVLLEDVEDSILLALLVTEVLHGRTNVRLETRYQWDRRQRQCTVDATTPSGRDFNRVLAGLMIREFGEQAFSVERTESTIAPAA